MLRMNWLYRCGLGSAVMCSILAMAPPPAAADDARAVITPAVVRTTEETGVKAPIEQVVWRRGWAGPGYYYRRGWGPGVGVYVGPRYYARPYYARPYYGGYYAAYPAYAYGYAPYGYGYGW